MDHNEDEPFYNKSIYFIVDNGLKKVTDISIDYNSNKAIDELEHPHLLTDNISTKT